jgi:CDK-activating kinase assembly factor MAT1
LVVGKEQGTMEDLGCPRCKTTKYRKASLKLLVNVCGHALCDSCVELLFAKGKQFPTYAFN